MKRFILINIILFCFNELKAQDERLTLSESELIQIVNAYHPFALQTNISIQQAETDVLNARGAFDPLIQSSFSKKELGGSMYYNYQQTELKIPTWYGIEFNAGIENVSGLNTDPQKTNLASSYAGVSFSVLKNILIDKRRATLQQAKIVVEQSQAERNAILNDLVYDAVTQYWEWVRYYREWLIVKEVVKTNEVRLNYTKQVVTVGERPAIDTTEALTQLFYYQSLQNELEMQMQNALIQLSTYTWKPSSEPYTLPFSLTPSTSSFATNEMDFMIPASEELIRDAMSSHPELEIYKSKFKFLDIEKKLKFQELLPDVKIKYNQLGKNYSVPETIAQPLLQNNYQYALSFAVPLRLSQGRAGYKQAKLKITSTELQLDLKQRMIENKIREQLNTLSMLRNQLNIQENLYQSQAILLKGEEIRFQNGESSLFLINSREQKNIETFQKLNATIAKYYKQKASLKWATGNLYIVK